MFLVSKHILINHHQHLFFQIVSRFYLRLSLIFSYILQPFRATFLYLSNVRRERPKDISSDIFAYVALVFNEVVLSGRSSQTWNFS